MSFIEALILGIVQGLTEFLPVSSSGHLVMLQRLMGIEEPTLVFNVAVHFATLIAVCIALWDQILKLLKKPFCRLTWNLVIASIPAAVIGFLLKDFFEGMNQSGISLGIGFIVTGCVLLLSARQLDGKKETDGMKWTDSLYIGLAQAIAIVPGISRSGMTLSAGLSRDMKKEHAIRFAFLMSIPVILGGFIFELADVASQGMGGIDWVPITTGMAAAALSGYFAIRLFIRMVMKGRLSWFSIYVFILAAFVLADQLFVGRFFGRLF